MVNILGAEIPTPSLKIGTTGLMIIFIIVMLVFLSAIAFFIIYRRMIYNKTIIVYENISGQGYQPAYRDKARLIRVGDGGEELLYLLKKKVFRTAYGKKMGKNTYWFAIGQDGYWYNVVLGDLDAKMGMLDIEPIDRDMRYMHVAVRKNIQDRYRKIKFMEKYGTILMSGIFLLIMLGGIWFLLNKMSDIAGTINQGMTVANEVAQLNGKVLSAIENVCSSSGFVQAT